MVNFLLPFETDNDGENEAATTLRRSRFDVGVGNIADVFCHRVALAAKFPLNSWTRRCRNFYLNAGSSYGPSNEIGRMLAGGEADSTTSNTRPIARAAIANELS